MMADRIARTAHREGISLSKARDRALLGKTWMGARAAPNPTAFSRDRAEEKKRGRREGEHYVVY